MEANSIMMVEVKTAITSGPKLAVNPNDDQVVKKISEWIFQGQKITLGFFLEV